VKRTPLSRSGAVWSVFRSFIDAVEIVEIVKSQKVKLQYKLSEFKNTGKTASIWQAFGTRL